MSSHVQHLWQYFQQHRRASLVTGHLVVVSALVLVVLGSTFGPSLIRTFAQAPCASGDQTYVVQGGDTLGAIANRYHTDWQRLASYNKLPNPNLIYVAQHICIPGNVNTNPVTVNKPVNVAAGTGNPFPFPQCTWWASQRYHQLHGIYVPWATNSNAWQWTARANEFHWRVSSTPTVGSIVDLQPWVQGAWSLGHVAIAEKILPNGHVLTSNMNWGPNPAQVAYVEIAPGPGVTFISAS